MKNTVTLLVILAAVLSACGFRVGETQTFNEAVPLGEAEVVDVDIRMAAGELALSGGADALMNADITTNRTEWAPDIDYNETGTSGDLTIYQAENSIVDLNAFDGDTLNEWDIHLSNNVPLDLEVTMGAGTSTLTLGGLTLRHLQLQLGAGESTIDFTGKWSDNLTADIMGGVGRMEMIFPDDVGVRINFQSGVGNVSASGFEKRGSTFLNDNYNEAETTIAIELIGGLGDIILITE